MKLTEQIATHIRELHFGENWTAVNMKESLAGIDWQQATTPLQDLNTIAALVYHSNYFVDAILKVLRGEALDSKDSASFDHPPIHAHADWDKVLHKTFADAEAFAELVEQMPETKLWENFKEEKYGNYYKNIHGVIEHTYYHLGQINILKKMLAGKIETSSTLQ
jgi:hypothetical protein